MTCVQYDTLQQQLPDCEILWNVPLNGGVPSNSRQLEMKTLSEADTALLKYLPMLQTLDLRGCRDYSSIMAAKEMCPDAEVFYDVLIGGCAWPQDTLELTLPRLCEEDLPLLQYLPELRQVNLEGDADLLALTALKEAHPNITLSYQVSINGNAVANNETALSLSGSEPDEILEKLAYLPDVTTVSLEDPGTDHKALAALVQAYPHIDFHWELNVHGVTLSSADRQADFSEAEFDSIEQIEQALACFPKLETVYLGECGIENDALAAYRDRVRDQYKVVWKLRLGLMPVRTDDVFFMPAKDHYYVTDEQMNLLVYCEDLICVDVGHFQIRHCEWAAHLPKLKYLIIADAPLRDITPLSNLKELVFLELFLTDVTDYTPLLSITSLEDLNLSFCYGDPEPLKQMTWLKRLWWADADITEEEYQKYLPNTELMFMPKVSSTGLGWREGQHYYDMRDLMGMEYMYH